jgi:hypothetical protein
VIVVNEALRWTLVLGCLLLAILEAPHSALLLVQDLRGPWRPEPVVSLAPAVKAAVPSSSTLQDDRAFASVEPENDLATDRRTSDRPARDLAAGKFAFLLAR